jgi:hypothetical protein
LRYLEAEFDEVQPLVFGHFGEVNRRFLELIDALIFFKEARSWLFVSKEVLEVHEVPRLGARKQV